MQINQKKIIKEARNWLGTPFHHQASRKNIGCDCIGFIIGIARALYGKNRLFIALLRARGIPARLCKGLILENTSKRTSHAWTEIFVVDKWIPFCPTNGYFAEIPENYPCAWTSGTTAKADLSGAMAAPAQHNWPWRSWPTPPATASTPGSCTSVSRAR